MSTESVTPSNHLILCHPLLLPPSIFPSIRVFLNESVLCIRRPKYWSFSYSIGPSNKYSGLISFRIWLVGSPCSSRDSQEFSLTPQFKSIRIDKSKQRINGFLGIGVLESDGIRFLFGLMKVFPSWLWWWIHNSLNILSHHVVHFKL